MTKQKQTKKILFALTLLMIVSPILANVVVMQNANGLSRACANSEACRAAAAKEEEASQNAASAAATANAYQNRVNEIKLDIAQKELEIAETEAQIKDLNKQIAEAEQKLQEERKALAELVVNMHFSSDAEPIRVLAGASSISDLAEKAAREDVAKKKITAKAESVLAMKTQLEEDKAKVEELYNQQQLAKQELISSQSTMQSLAEKYGNDADAYAEVAEQARLEKIRAEQAEQQAHPDLYGGSAYSGANTYPWQDDCPGKQDYYVTYRNGKKIGGYVCECVSYVGWKAYEYYGVAPAWGNAYSWDDGARRAGYRVDNTPAAGTIGQTDSGPYGHVFWVESVNADGSIDVSEYNNSWSTGQLTGSYHMGDFGSRRISAGAAASYNYIHFD